MRHVGDFATLCDPHMKLVLEIGICRMGGNSSICGCSDDLAKRFRSHVASAEQPRCSRCHKLIRQDATIWTKIYIRLHKMNYGIIACENKYSE